jgi:dolichyldiphosphatase
MHLGKRRVIEFTYGEYPEDSPYFGLFMAIISYSPLIAVIVVSTLTVALRSWNHFVFFCGLVVSHGLATVIKKTWKQPRPDGAYLSNYGMPSDHSMFMFFIATHVISQMWDDAALRRHSFIVSSIGLLTLSGLIGYSRLFLGVHSLEQVIVGVVFGVVLGRVWYYVSKLHFQKWSSLSGLFDTLHGNIGSVFYATNNSSRSKYQ